MPTKTTFFTLLFGLTGLLSTAQPILITPEVALSSAVYGSNFTTSSLSTTGHTSRQDLHVDIYELTGSTTALSPLVILLHSGELPTSPSCYGTPQDSAVVEMAIRLVQRGYVVAAIEYRLDWQVNLTGNAPIITALYRGMQDTRTAIRYFRKTAAEANNPYQIDSEKIIVWGLGTGGSVALMSAYWNTYEEIIQVVDPFKFLGPAPNSSNFFPIVTSQYNGDIAAESTTAIVDNFYNNITNIPVGDTLSVPNHAGYSSSFCMAVNLGGFLLDSSWVNPGEMPLISYHVADDAWAPCETGLVSLPTLSGPVMEVSGSCTVQSSIAHLGNNAIFDNIPPSQLPVSTSNLNGLYVFYGTPMNSHEPWSWGASTPCNTNAVSSRAYIDTILNYAANRITWKLYGELSSGTNQLALSSLTSSPNPAFDHLTFQADPNGAPIEQLILLDALGRQVMQSGPIQSHQYILQKGNLTPGYYVALVQVGSQYLQKKVFFR